MTASNPPPAARPSTEVVLVVMPRAVVALVTAGLLLAGCSARPGVAAVVDGEPIRESRLAETVHQLNEFSEAPARSILQALVISPFWLEAAAQVGVGASVEEGREHLDAIHERAGVRPPEGGYVPGLLEIGRVLVSQEKALAAGVDQELTTLAEGLVADAEIEISPRYGEWSDRGITPVTSDWFVTAPSPVQ